jgi:hypothetical protein
MAERSKFRAPHHFDQGFQGHPDGTTDCRLIIAHLNNAQ